MEKYREKSKRKHWSLATSVTPLKYSWSSLLIPDLLENHKIIDSLWILFPSNPLRAAAKESLAPLTCLLWGGYANVSLSLLTLLSNFNEGITREMRIIRILTPLVRGCHCEAPWPCEEMGNRFIRMWCSVLHEVLVTSSYLLEEIEVSYFRWMYRSGFLNFSKFILMFYIFSGWFSEFMSLIQIKNKKAF